MSGNNFYPFSFYYKYIFVLSATDDPHMHAYSGCTHLLFFHCGMLKRMYSSPSALPRVFNVAYGVLVASFVALPSQPLVE